MPVFEIHTTQIITETYRLLVEAEDADRAMEWAECIAADLRDVHGAVCTQRSSPDDGDILDCVEVAEAPAEQALAEKAVFRTAWDGGSSILTYCVPDGWRQMGTAPKEFPEGIPVEKTASPVMVLFAGRDGTTSAHIAVWADQFCGGQGPHWRILDSDNGTPATGTPIAWQPLQLPDGWQPMETAPKGFTATTHFTNRAFPLLVRHSAPIILSPSPGPDLDDMPAVWGRADQLGAATYPCWRDAVTGIPVGFIPVAWRVADSLEASANAVEGNGEAVP